MTSPFVAKVMMPASIDNDYSSWRRKEPRFLVVNVLAVEM
jgi:hypothetical protein